MKHNLQGIREKIQKLNFQSTHPPLEVFCKETCVVDVANKVSNKESGTVCVE